MIKNRTVQLIYQTLYCTLGLVGIIASLGIFDNINMIHPYFFVNLDTQGIPGVLMWIVILSVAFVAVGFLFFGLDRLGKKLAEKL